MRPILAIALLLLAAPAAVLAHHGWGSYDASKAIIVEGPILTSKFEMPHALISVKGADKTWNVVLAPTSRMTARGASAAFVGVGKIIKAEGYASKAESGEMRAERITVDGKTVEMR